MAIRVSPTQEFDVPPQLEAYDSYQAWFHDLTDWFIQTGLKVNQVEPPIEPESKPKRTIARWTSTKPMKFKTFRQQQARLIQGGHSPVLYGNYSKPCPACSCTERISIGMRRGRKDAATFDICLHCWSVVESIAVYDGDNES